MLAMTFRQILNTYLSNQSSSGVQDRLKIINTYIIMKTKYEPANMIHGNKGDGETKGAVMLNAGNSS